MTHTISNEDWSAAINAVQTVARLEGEKDELLNSMELLLPLVNNPSAWQTFDQTVSDKIAYAVVYCLKKFGRIK